MRNAVYIVLLAGVVLAWGMAGIAARSSGKSPFADIPFEHVIIDGHPPLNQLPSASETLAAMGK